MRQSSLIPRRLLFADPDRFAVQISPDGRHFTWMAAFEGARNVWIAPTDRPTAAEPLTRIPGRGVSGGYHWVADSRHLIYYEDKDGDENYRVVRLDTRTGATMLLSPEENVRGMVAAVSPQRPDAVILAHNGRDARFFDVYLVDLGTGEATLVALNDAGFAHFICDRNLDLRFAVRTTEDGGRDFLQPDGEGGWSLFEHLAPEDGNSFGIRGFTADGRTAYLVDPRGRDTTALYSLDCATGERTLIGADDRADIGSVQRANVSGELVGYSIHHARTHWTWANEEWSADFGWVQDRMRGEASIADTTLDDRTWIVFDVQDDGPGQYYAFDRDRRSLSFLFDLREQLSDHTLSKMHPVILTARDRLELVSFLTLPKGEEGGPDQRPDTPPPMVLLVHGGPWARDFWGFRSDHQWLSDRGYAVLSVNFRASAGFGKRFMEAGTGEWAAKMHDDLLDAVAWAVERGHADPDRIAIMGGSYGGYAALVGLTFTPEVFACAVDVVGPSHLATLLESFPPYWQSIRANMVRRIGGDPAMEEGRRYLDARSPLNFVDRIRRPLLIIQGANDPRVKRAQSDRIVEVMTEKGIPVTYVLYPDEGHGLTRSANRIAYSAIAEQFLAKHLGGAAQPIGRDLEGASAEFVAGSDVILQDTNRSD